MDEESIRDMTMPFAVYWYRVENCRFRKIDGEWVIYFSGKVTPYEVGFETYRDILNLKLPSELIRWRDELTVPAEPIEGVLDFFRKWGPLGLFYRDIRRTRRTKDMNSWLVEVEKSQRKIPIEEHWMKYHTRKFRLRKSNEDLPDVDEVFDGYYENWKRLGFLLAIYQDWFKDIRESKDSFEYNQQTENVGLRPFLYDCGDGKYEWSFVFNWLLGALFGLLGQELIGKVDMRICQNPSCGNYFDAIETGRTTYCTPKCQREGPDKRRLQDPVKKYRRMLKERLKRCPEELVSQEKSQSINAELLQAKSVKELKNIEEKKYPVILGIKRGRAK